MPECLASDVARMRIADGQPQRIGPSGAKNLLAEEARLIGDHRTNGDRKYYLSNLPAESAVKDWAVSPTADEEDGFGIPSDPQPRSGAVDKRISGALPQPISNFTTSYHAPLHAHDADASDKGSMLTSANVVSISSIKGWTKHAVPFL